MIKAKSHPAPPRGLHKTARVFWVRTVADYEFDAEELAVLESACRLLSRAEEAAALVAKEGITMVTAKGIPCAHPATRVESAARTGWLTHCKMLGLIQQPPPGGKQGSKHYRGGYNCA